MFRVGRARTADVGLDDQFRLPRRVVETCVHARPVVDWSVVDSTPGTLHATVDS
jgi:hypothetical protein